MPAKFIVSFTHLLYRIKRQEEVPEDVQYVLAYPIDFEQTDWFGQDDGLFKMLHLTEYLPQAKEILQTAHSQNRLQCLTGAVADSSLRPFLSSVLRSLGIEDSLNDRRKGIHLVFIDALRRAGHTVLDPYQR